MTDDTANALMDMYDKWDRREERRRFISRMEHKLHSKERHTPKADR